MRKIRFKPGHGISLRDDIVRGLQFIFRLPGYLHHPLTITESKAILKQRLEHREDDFLDLFRRTVWENRQSPYRSLLQLAGGEYGDIEGLVRQDGVEGTLRALFRAGVYLTVDEYKGRQPVKRGQATIRVDPQRLRNPLMSPQFRLSTGGSRGPATLIPFDFDCIRDRAVNIHLAQNSRGGEHWRNAVWGMPCIAPLFWFSSWGTPVAQRFMTLDPTQSGLHPRYKWSSRAITWTSRLAGKPLPFPEYVSVDKPFPVTQWMVGVLKTGEIPHLWASSSSAVNVCSAAKEADLNLTGAQFTLVGEPITLARLNVIRSVGAEAVPDYGSADSGGSAGHGCMSPEEPDDVHIFSDLNGVIQADSAPFPKGAILISSIRPTTPFIFLNVSMGDCATISYRRCGCPLEDLGWPVHLHTIRSFEKLTARGMTFEDGDVTPVLEEILPRRFGGGPTDYQLVEELTDEGQIRLRLLVNPAVGALDPEKVSDFFLEALGTGSPTRQVMALHWKESKILSIERRQPFATSSGKILHIWTKSNSVPGGSV